MSKKRFSFLFALMLFFGFSNSAKAMTCNYTASPNEKNSIQNALNQAQPGQTVCLQSGTYLQDIVSVRNGTASAPITITGPKDAVVKGGGNGRVIEINHDYITLSGFTVDGLFGSSSSQSGYRDKLLYAIGKTAGDGVNGLKVQNMTFKNAGGECIRLKYLAQNNEISSCNISDCGIYDFKFNAGGKNGEGIYIGTAPEQLSKNPSSVVDASSNNWIHNNVINTNGNEGVDIKEGSTGNIVEYNTVSGQTDPNSGGLDSRGDGNTFRYNTVSGSAGAGVRLGGDGSYGKNNNVYGNTLTNNKYGAIKIQIAPQGTICGNILSGNGSGVGSYGSQYNYTSVCSGVPAPTPTPTPDPTPVSGSILKLNVSKVSASTYDTRYGGCTPQKTLDNDFSTRWAGEGNGAWIKYDLGSAKTVSYLNIAFYKGDSRTQKFSIQLSPDGSSWTTVYSGSSSGKTLNFQKFDFADKQARYVRIVGYGNTENNWNSLTETQIYGF